MERRLHGVAKKRRAAIVQMLGQGGVIAPRILVE
jgi:uncharacterized membrane protein YGL010W